VILLEGVNARDLKPTHVPEPVDCIVADVSFISLKLVLASALKFARDGAWLVALIKPQFEAGRGNIGKGGIVKDEEVQAKVLEGIVDWLGGQPGWSVIGTMESPVAGGDGNREFLLAARKS
jgi:23S rRNA (cytidine1920-2'-O)/16S rRNA (cytidine1409-2'-O)-methyltransferase